VGYQAEELGEENARRKLRFMEYYPVEAKICEIEGLSAHADQKGLLRLSDENKPKKVFLVHGPTCR
jgi:metallo-beta-lactamase family protein